MGVKLRAVLIACLGAASFSGCAPSASPEQLRDAGISRVSREVELASGDVIRVSALVREGVGTPLVYVHGTPSDAAAFFAYLEHPVSQSPAVSIDRPGFGDSEPNRVVTSYEEQARAVLAWCDEPAVLVGHSLGGPIIARAAADAPDRVAALVILAGSLDPDLEAPRWFNHLADGPLGGLLSRSMRNSNDEIMGAPEEAKLLAGLLGRVTCPVVIVHGVRDTLVPFANVAFMERAFSGAQHVETVVLPRARHMIVWTHEEECRAAIERAIELASEASGARVTDGT